MNIRNARTEELGEVSKVIEAAYHQYAASLSRELWESYARSIADVRSRLSESELIVAEEDDRILGSVTFYPDGSASKGEGWPSGYACFRILAVHPDARGRGLGRMLTLECIRRARELGVRCIGLHTTELMSVARAMYERMGFKRAPEYDMTPGPGIVVLAYRLDM